MIYTKQEMTDLIKEYGVQQFRIDCIGENEYSAPSYMSPNAVIIYMLEGYSTFFDGTKEQHSFKLNDKYYDSASIDKSFGTGLFHIMLGSDGEITETFETEDEAQLALDKIINKG